MNQNSKGCTTKIFFLMSSSHHPGGNQCYQVLMYCYKEQVFFLSKKKTAKLGVFFYAIHILFTNICFQRFFIDIYTEYYMCLLNTVFALHRNNSE